jgi:drug/metabolite transporter (DMT)-like permease
LGEQLQLGQWTAALGLCGLSAMFFFKGHAADLSRKGRLAYVKLVALSVLLSSLDHVLTKNTNWFSLLLVSNITLLAVSLALNHTRIPVLKQALFNKYAALAGLFYMMTELVKFYQQVTINPVTVVVTAQAATKPVILVLSALLWKERTVKEQLVWGILAFIVTLPLFL